MKRSATTQSMSPYVEPHAREYTIVEKNAIYYAAGYVIRRTLKKFKMADDDRGAAITSSLLNMIGEDTESVEATATYLDYVKTWTVKTDRGGLIHVSDDCFCFFCAVEDVTYEMLEKGSCRAEFITEVLDHQTVRFYWDVIASGLKDVWSKYLLHEIATLWFTIRGYTVAGRLLEEYKAAIKRNIKGSKGLRKELH